MNLQNSFLLILLVALTGCASSLQVSDGTTMMKGIPVHAPMLVEITTTTSYKGAPSLPAACPSAVYCVDQVTSTAKFLPLGKVYYVNFDSAAFAKSEFSLTFAETGVLTGVSLNSTPSVESFTGLLDTVLPFIKAPVAAAAAPAPAPLAPGIAGCPLSPAEVLKKHCIKTSTTVTKVEEIDVDYVN